MLIERIDISLTAARQGSEPSEAHRQALGFETGPVIALLDAAAHHQVPELLRAETSDAVCLWQGQAEEKWADQAPWLGTITTGGTLWRNFVTEGSAPWDWWPVWPGVLIQPRRTLSDLRTHLRKLSRVTDREGRSYFLRFWEPLTAAAFWLSHADDPDHVAWRYGADVAAVRWPGAEGICTAQLAEPVPAGPAPPNAIDQYRPHFKSAHWDHFTTRIGMALKEQGRPFDQVPQSEARERCNAARRAGYRSEAAIWDIVRASILLEAQGRDPHSEGRSAWKGEKPPNDLTAARLFLAHARRVTNMEPE